MARAPDSQSLAQVPETVSDAAVVVGAIAPEVPNVVASDAHVLKKLSLSANVPLLLAMAAIVKGFPTSVVENAWVSRALFPGPLSSSVASARVVEVGSRVAERKPLPMARNGLGLPLSAVMSIVSDPSWRTVKV